MSTKKILLIIGGVVAVLGLVIALFVGGIFYFAISAIGNSEAAGTAKNFLQKNERLRSDIGEVRDFGFWITGQIKSHGSDGQATLHLKVIGERKTVPASVNLVYRDGRSWNVVAATYKNDAGQTVNLLNPYKRGAGDGGGDVEESDEEGPNDSGDSAGKGFDEESFSANVLQAGPPVLVVFVSQSGLESRNLEQTLDELSEEYSERVNLVSYSVDEQPALSQRFNIEKLPVVLIYKDGRERERRAGAISKQQLSQLLDKYLEGR